MSSIRPLATITVLALVGVFLYLKINETEPPLPEGVEDWSTTAELDFDMGGDIGGDIGSAAPTENPTFDTSPSGSSAPAFSASVATEAPAMSDSAPAWSDAPVSTAPPAETAPAPSFDASGTADAIAASMNLPDLPPLPTLPPAPSTAPSTDTVAKTDLPTDSVPPALAEPTLPPMAAAPAMTEPAAPPVADPVTSPANSSAQAQSSLFSATRLAVQAALDRGELSQALLLLSDWYGDPSLSPSETNEVNSLLGQLAGSVIYSTEHRLEPPYMVQAGERLETIAKKYEVPWQLLAKINGITSADQLQPGQQLKVIRGPFSALIDMSQRKMTLMLDRRYAGQFTLNLDPSVSVEEGHWEVNQKLLTPANVSLPTGGPTTPTEERSLMLSSSSGAAAQVAILRGSVATASQADPAGRVLRLNPKDAEDIFDILSLGSKVVIRR